MDDILSDQDCEDQKQKWKKYEKLVDKVNYKYYQVQENYEESQKQMKESASKLEETVSQIEQYQYELSNNSKQIELMEEYQDYYQWKMKDVKFDDINQILDTYLDLFNRHRFVFVDQKVVLELLGYLRLYYKEMFGGKDVLGNIQKQLNKIGKIKRVFSDILEYRIRNDQVEKMVDDYSFNQNWENSQKMVDALLKDSLYDRLQQYIDNELDIIQEYQLVEQFMKQLEGKQQYQGIRMFMGQCLKQKIEKMVDHVGVEQFYQIYELWGSLVAEDSCLQLKYIQQLVLWLQKYEFGRDQLKGLQMIEPLQKEVQNSLINRFVMPNLLYHLQKFEINPSNQQNITLIGKVMIFQRKLSKRQKRIIEVVINKKLEIVEKKWKQKNSENGGDYSNNNIEIEKWMEGWNKLLEPIRTE